MPRQEVRTASLQGAAAWRALHPRPASRLRRASHLATDPAEARARNGRLPPDRSAARQHGSDIPRREQGGRPSSRMCRLQSHHQDRSRRGPLGIQRTLRAHRNGLQRRVRRWWDHPKRRRRPVGESAPSVGRPPAKVRARRGSASRGVTRRRPTAPPNRDNAGRQARCYGLARLRGSPSLREMRRAIPPADTGYYRRR
jgi:hypothetical protein